MIKRSWKPFRMTTRRAFTLVETLVVIGVMGLLISLMIPAIQMVRAAMDRAACVANLRQIGQAVYQFHNDHGSVPPGRHMLRIGPLRHMLRWEVGLLPYVGRGDLWEQALQNCKTGIPEIQNPPHRALDQVIRVYTCPSDARLKYPIIDGDGISAAYGTFMGVSGSMAQKGVFAVQYGKPGIRLFEITDGLSQTLMMGERPPPDSGQAGKWYPSSGYPASSVFQFAQGPNSAMPVDMNMFHVGAGCGGAYYFRPGRTDRPCDRYHFWSLHPRGGNWLFADGSCRFLSYQARDLIPALASIAGQDPVMLPD